MCRWTLQDEFQQPSSLICARHAVSLLRAQQLGLNLGATRAAAQRGGEWVSVSGQPDSKAHGPLPTCVDDAVVIVLVQD